MLLQGFFLLNKVMLGDCSPKSPVNIFASAHSPLHTYSTVHTDWVFAAGGRAGRKRERERDKKSRQGALTKRKSYLKSENPGSRPNIPRVMSSFFFSSFFPEGAAFASARRRSSHSLSALSKSRALHLHPTEIVPRSTCHRSGCKTHVWANSLQ